MTYQEIPTTEIKKHILDIFPGQGQEDLLLNVDNIYKLVNLNGIKSKLRDIIWWNRFMNDDPEIGDDVFIELLLKGIDGNDKILLVTDEGIFDKIGFSFYFKDLDAFKYIYEYKYKMEFFQDSDYIFIIPAKKQISVLMHEGRYAVWRQT